MHTPVGASTPTQHASVAGTCLTISSISNLRRSPTVLVFGTKTESSSQTSPVVFRVLNRALLPPFLSQFMNDTYLDRETAVEHAGSRHGSFAMASSCACNHSPPLSQPMTLPHCEINLLSTPFPSCREALETAWRRTMLRTDRHSALPLFLPSWVAVTESLSSGRPLSC